MRGLKLKFKILVSQKTTKDMLQHNI